MTFVQDPDTAQGVAATVEESASTRTQAKATPADWNVLAYLAGDNNLEDSLLADLREMERVGSRPGVVDIVAQIDRPAGARRYYVTRHTGATIGSKVLADLGATNTGDPRVLQSFVAFGAQRYPAQASLLILSNHGSGFYVPPAMLSKRRQHVQRVAQVAPSVRRAFSRAAREWLLAIDPGRRGILYDDGAGDCLDNRELTKALAAAHRVLARPVDIVGMDACLMTMLEVAYQLRDHARILVGSEEVEPGAGWPYVTVLGDLIARPTMAAAELATTIVQRYAESYGGTEDEATQSAIDLAKLDEVVGSVDALARALLKALPNASLEAAIYSAWRRTLRFFDNLYADLHDLVKHLAAATDRAEIGQCCVAVRRALEASPGPILAAAHVGARLRAARGLSIYFPPFREPSIFYKELLFAQRTRWADFLDAYLGKRKDR
jgi:hypothetical protein